MKGATTEPCANTSNTPKSNIITMIGDNQNFFLTLRNSHNSCKNNIIFISFNFKINFI